jgi:hypothetical protein
MICGLKEIDNMLFITELLALYLPLFFRHVFVSQQLLLACKVISIAPHVRRTISQ